MKTFAANTNHEFWQDALSLRNKAHFVANRIHGGRQVPDVYLLALANSHSAYLLSFDETIPLSAVPGASHRNLMVI